MEDMSDLHAMQVDNLKGQYIASVYCISVLHQCIASVYCMAPCWPVYVLDPVPCVCVRHQATTYGQNHPHVW